MSSRSWRQCDRGLSLLIEKPLATELADSQRVLDRNHQSQGRCRRRLHAALPPALAGGEGEGAHRQPGRRDDGDLARVHEPPGRARQLQAHLDPSKISPMVISGHARARHRHVDDGGEEAGRALRALGGQGARADLQGHRCHRRHDHLRGRQPLPRVDLLGAAGGLAGRGVQPGGRHHRHRGRAHHRRHASRYCSGHNEESVGRLRARFATARGLPRQLSAGRHGAGRAARADARRDRAVAEPRLAWATPRSTRPPPRRTTG